MREVISLPASFVNASDEAEVYALALAILATVEQPHVKPGKVVQAHTDCRNAIGLFQDERLLPPEIGSLVRKAWAAVEEKGCYLAFVWMRSHQPLTDHRSRHNRWCDLAAGKAMRALRKTSLGAMTA